MKEEKTKEELSPVEEQAKAYYSLVIENTADEVWAAIRDFQDTRWMGEDFNYQAGPETSVRSLSAENGEVLEHLLIHADDDRFYTYNNSGSLPANVEDFQATIRVTPTEGSDNAYVEWSAVFICPELEKANRVKYYTDNAAKALNALNKHL